ncbi:venom protease-like [Onthophagus taurus]|uniref:venom protease-like n=1 Tax=Onthophagus taurus TaxID=166361 RepID=UPI0039BE83AC
MCALLFLLSVSLVVNSINCQENGVPCRTREGRLGRCVSINKCDMKRIRPRFCGYGDYEELFCCSNDNRKNRGNVNSRSSSSKSQQKCQEYSSKISRTYYDYNPWGSFGSFNAIVSGQNSFPREFPHMHFNSNIIFFSGDVEFVRLGDLDLASNNDDSEPQQFQVKRTYEHPDYKLDSRYHDVGLIEIETVRFSNYIKPACLYTSQEIPSSRLIATGWGSQVYAGSPVSFLQKVELRHSPFQECKDTYRPEKELENGIVDEWQICAGGGNRGDTCQGDSGSPLQYKSPKDSLFLIVGVVSFGKLCGVAPGVYTRVSYYVPWIESIVWPN